MPDRPLAYCSVPGCPARVVRGRCYQHQGALDRDRERTRPNRDVRKWYRLEAWAWLRRVVLQAAAYSCAACGVITVDLHVDHIRPHHGDRVLFWSRSNLQALCARCHQLKTQRGE